MKKLNIFDSEGFVKGEKVLKFLKFRKKEDVATATDLSVSTIRFKEEKMTFELKDKLFQWAKVINYVLYYFKDEKTATIWFNTPNLLLNGMSPRDKIRVGQFEKLQYHIYNALNRDRWP